eukprot:SAG11_NODE_6591_length_1282_cov_1.566357_1_plen_197_part_00
MKRKKIGRPRATPLKADAQLDIARDLTTPFRPLPFCTRELQLEPPDGQQPQAEPLGRHRVWIENLPYDVTLSTLRTALSNVALVRGATIFRPPLSVATLGRRRRAEQAALEKAQLEQKGGTLLPVHRTACVSPSRTPPMPIMPPQKMRHNGATRCGCAQRWLESRQTRHGLLVRFFAVIARTRWRIADNMARGHPK